MRTVKNIGETGLIKRFIPRTACKPSKKIIVPNGDDACACAWRKGKVLIASSDMLIEDVHFSARWNRWEDIGYKAMAVNISDMAAMGNVLPLYALISIGLPPSTSVDIVDKIFTGLWKISKKVGISLVGGDTVKSSKDIVISISLIGEGDKKDIIQRSGAYVGDKVLISGLLGISGAGLNVLAGTKKHVTYSKKNAYMSRLVNAHLRPPIRISFGKYVGRTHRATSMIDSSDGLHRSLEQVSSASGVGFNIYLDRIPVSSDLKRWCSKQNTDVYTTMLFGGEDYELVCTASEKNARKIVSSQRGSCIIGDVIHKCAGIQYWLKGKRVSVSKQKGYEHFS